MRIAILTHAHSRNTNVVGAIHYANSWVNTGHKVRLITTPLSIFQAVFFGYRKTIRNKLRAYFGKGSVLDGRVEEIVPLSFLPFGAMPWIQSIFGKNLNFIFVRLKLNDIDLVILESPFFIDYISSYKGKVIYRATDNYSSFYNRTKLHHEEVSIHRAERVISTSRPLSRHLECTYGLEEVNSIVNGLNLSTFICNENVHNNQREGCVYIGSFDFRFDFNLLIALSESINERIDLYGVIGSKILRQLEGYTNINYKGVIKYEEVPRILRMYKVGLMPFKDIRANRSRSPMKLYEYLYSGLWVVFKGIELEEENFGAIGCETNSEFIEQTIYFLAKSEWYLPNTIDKTLGWDYKAAKLLEIANE